MLKVVPSFSSFFYRYDGIFDIRPLMRKFPFFHWRGSSSNKAIQFSLTGTCRSAPDDRLARLPSSPHLAFFLVFFINALGFTPLPPQSSSRHGHFASSETWPCRLLNSYYWNWNFVAFPMHFRKSFRAIARRVSSLQSRCHPFRSNGILVAAYTKRKHWGPKEKKNLDALSTGRGRDWFLKQKTLPRGYIFYCVVNPLWFDHQISTSPAMCDADIERWWIFFFPPRVVYRHIARILLCLRLSCIKYLHCFT